MYQFRRSIVDLRRFWGWLERQRLPLESKRSIDFLFGGRRRFGRDFGLEMFEVWAFFSYYV